MVRNLKPAPFAMTPPIVRQMLVPGVPVSKGMIRIPVLPVVLAEEVKGSITTSSDVPATIRPDCTATHYNSKSFATPSARMDGPEEPARVAPVPAAPSAPAEFPNLGRPDNGAANVIDPFVWGVFKSDYLRPQLPALKHCYERTKMIAEERGILIPSEATFRRLIMREIPCRKTAVKELRSVDAAEGSDPRDPAAYQNFTLPYLVSHRHEKIALPAPRDRMDAIREPARKKPLPPLASDVRRAQLNAATAFLKRRGILVTPCDREAQIRKYRVTGKAEAQFLEQVVEIAISYGFEADRV